MKHLIVVAHPILTSLTMSVTRLHAAELEKLGHLQQTYDLYRMGFDPVLTATELGGAGNPTSFAILRAKALSCTRPNRSGRCSRECAVRASQMGN